MSWRKKPPRPDIVHNDVAGAKKRLKKLKRGFSRISHGWARRSRRKQLFNALLVPTAAGIGSFALIWFLLSSPWGVMLTLKHLAAFPNCAAAEAVGLAPAFKGQPGYWFHHDADHDGVACEAARWHSDKHYHSPKGGHS